MRIPITGNPRIDGVTVRLALLGLRVHSAASSRLRVARVAAAEFSVLSWQRRQLRLAVKHAWAARKAFAARVYPSNPRPVSKWGDAQGPCLNRSQKWIF